MKIFIWFALSVVTLPRGMSAQEREYEINLPAGTVPSVNDMLARGGAKSRLLSLEITRHLVTGSNYVRVAYLLGNVQMSCGAVTRKVEIAKVDFVVPAQPEVSQRMIDTLRSIDYHLAPPVVALAFLSSPNHKDVQAKVAKGLLWMAFRICGMPDGDALHMSLSLWLKPDGSDGDVLYSIINFTKYKELMARSVKR